LMQMVNSLTSNLQIGSPMASLYLLKHPDHYTNYNQRTMTLTVKRRSIKLRLDAPTSRFHASAIRPLHTSLYDFIQMTTRLKRTPKQHTEFLASLAEGDAVQSSGGDNLAQANDDWLEKDIPDQGQEDLLDVQSGDVSVHAFHQDQPLWETHYIRCARRNLDTVVPNFVGGALPRMDQGDREYYCCTMLTLFKPWRNGLDLKCETESWHETFGGFLFSNKSLQLMKHFNIRYECNDARDDYSSQDRQKRRAMPLFGGLGQTSDESAESDEQSGEWEDVLGVDLSATVIKGPKQLAKEKLMREAKRVLQTAAW
ncbi:hypothetical protein DFH08DRAFT_647070, partial [Mycena albidolilacea]